ncbi:hypothetical protein E2562_017696 [Oryza meyeriana var. granulata]|uniref:Uncharacterized protein n=1 Tax=Oryza meyeriana var. granulata TaxID=110450 RepID=A0A6G1BX68_9ORYZ|nr:hypothetical protein E2562_017696 [Oryza meyeriana var. granulata]
MAYVEPGDEDVKERMRRWRSHRSLAKATLSSCSIYTEICVLERRLLKFHLQVSSASAVVDSSSSGFHLPLSRAPLSSHSPSHHLLHAGTPRAASSAVLPHQIDAESSRAR